MKKAFFSLTDELEGTYTFSTTIEDERYNRISFCDEEDTFFCRSTSKCETQEFVFTVERQQTNEQQLQGTFEGTVCSEEGVTVNITDGTFVNLELFPN
ncbi:MAG: hypothetical protein AAF551_02580 [Bacteroidota bacterium]